MSQISTSPASSVAPDSIFLPHTTSVEIGSWPTGASVQPEAPTEPSPNN
jgi:uncharacterized protein YeaC (DUF1315 family)